MVSLAATAVVEDRLTAMRVTDRRQTCGHFSDRGVPVNLFETAVTAPTERTCQAVRAILVEIDAMGLLTGIALRSGMRIVAAHLYEAAAVFTAKLYLDTTITLTENAGSRFPLSLGGSGRDGMRWHCDLLTLRSSITLAVARLVIVRAAIYISDARHVCCIRNERHHSSQVGFSS
jgi:hypothetical protein